MTTYSELMLQIEAIANSVTEIQVKLLELELKTLDTKLKMNSDTTKSMIDIMVKDYKGEDIKGDLDKLTSIGYVLDDKN